MDTPAPKTGWLVGGRGRALAVSVVLVGALAWVMRKGGLPLLPPQGALARVNWLYVSGFVLGMAVNMTTRFGRCHFLIEPLAPVPFRRILTINAIANALITFLPLRIGEFARPAMLRERGRLSAWAVTATVGAERILDGVAFSATLLIGLALATPQDPIPDHVGDLPIPAYVVPQAARLGSLAFGLGFVVMIGFFAYRKQARRLTERVLGVVSHGFASKVADIIERLSDGLKFLLDVRHSIPYVVITLVSVVAQVWGTELLAIGVGLPELTFSEAMVVTGVVALGFAMPNAPGFFGTVQFALYAALAAYIAPEKVADQGAVLVFLFYVTYLALVVFFAAIALVTDAVWPDARETAPAT